MLAHMIEHFFDRPGLPDGDKIGSHKSTHCVFWVAQEFLGNGALFGIEQLKQLSDGAARKLLEERRAVIWRHFVENLDALLLAHGMEELLLSRYSNTSVAS